ARDGRDGVGAGPVGGRGEGDHRLLPALRLRPVATGGGPQGRGRKVAMDSATLQFLAAPFVASLIIAGIHAYLGVQVVERGVIFVALSLAQIAALGSAVALLLPFSGGDAHGAWVYWVSLGSTLVGAAIFATIRSRQARIPQEAIIGIAYAVASAGT